MTKTQAPAKKAAKSAANLSQPYIDKLRPKAAPFRVWDTNVPQLFIRVQPSGIRSWNLQWGRGTSKSLGKWPGVTVEAARVRARALLIETHEHGAPLEVVEANKPDHEKPRTFAEFVEHDYGPWAEQHQRGARETVRVLRTVFEPLADKLLTSIAPLDIERIKAKRLKAGRAPATVRRELALLHGALSRAVEWEMLPAHPMRQVKGVRGDDNQRVRYLSDDEDRRLSSALAEREAKRRTERANANRWRVARGHEPWHEWSGDEYTDHLMPLVLLAVNTGLRRGELLALQWESVNLDTRLLTVAASTAKSRRTRHVPLNAEAHDVLTRWHKQHGNPASGPVFPARDGEASISHFKGSWEAIVDTAKLEDFHFHDLRHTFASRLVMRGIDLNTVRELLGHADLKMTLRYAHLAPAKLASAVAVLDAPREPAEAQVQRAEGGA
jgi:integrase